MVTRPKTPQGIKHIFFVGRLTQEKGIEIVLDSIRLSQIYKKPYIFHIIGEGVYREAFREFGENFVIVYGHLGHDRVLELLKHQADVLLMPSLFLETFGLTALEALSVGVPVIGFKKGGLEYFIPDKYALSTNKPSESFIKIMDTFEGDIIDIQQFSYENWKTRLHQLTKNSQRILLVHDYNIPIGGAEMYLFFLRDELQLIGKDVEIFGYNGNLSKIKKIFFLFLSIYNPLVYRELLTVIQNFNPDLIWCHSVLRYIGYAGVKAIANSGICTYSMHHDLGLVSPRPSNIADVRDIPNSLTFYNWTKNSKGLLEHVLVYFKLYTIKKIWNTFPKNTLHLVPSDWIKSVFSQYTNKVEVFYHTLIPHKK